MCYDFKARCTHNHKSQSAEVRSELHVNVLMQVEGVKYMYRCESTHKSRLNSRVDM